MLCHDVNCLLVVHMCQSLTCALARILAAMHADNTRLWRHMETSLTLAPTPHPRVVSEGFGRIPGADRKAHGQEANSNTLPTISRPVGTCIKERSHLGGKKRRKQGRICNARQLFGGARAAGGTRNR